MTDWKALCAELAEDLDLWLVYDGAPSELPAEQELSMLRVSKTYAALRHQPQDAHQRIHYLLQFMKTANQTWDGHLEHRLYCLIGEADDPENHY